MVPRSPRASVICKTVLPVTAYQVNRNWTGAVSNGIPRPKLDPFASLTPYPALSAVGFSVSVNGLVGLHIPQDRLHVLARLREWD